jgi:hypothetical protein
VVLRRIAVTNSKEKCMTSSSRKIVFALAAVVGVFVTRYFNLQFMVETGGFSLTQFLAATYANNASASISNDLLVVVFTFSIAIAFAFPLFMFMRERAIENSK